MSQGQNRIENVKTLSRNVAISAYYDLGLRTFLSNVFSLMAGGLAVTAITAWYISNHLDAWLSSAKATGDHSLLWFWIGAVLLELILVIFMSWRGYAGKLSAKVGITIFTLYAFLNGVTLSPVLLIYTGVSIARVFFITAAAFSGCALWGYVTKKDLSGWGSFLLMGLLGLIGALIANMFFASSRLDFIITGAGILIFTGLTAYDTQRLRKEYDERGNGSPGLVVYGALILYLDFVNLFLYILRWVGELKK